MVDPKECKVALLFGGISGEREVSLKSGEGVRGALEEAGFSVTAFDPAEKDDLTSLMEGDFDVAFLALHGKGGEDGCIQGFLETIGIPYTGSDVCASAIAMNKSRSKTLYAAAGIPTAPSMTLTSNDDEAVAAVIEKLGTRVVVKVSTEGSSLGLYMVKSEDELREALDKAFALTSEVLVEKFVEGREFTCAVVGNEDAAAYPVIEIIPQKDEFYDFESKYAPGGSTHVCPADLPEQVARTIQERAVRAHHVLGCSGVSRSDFLLDENGESWILETNTLPGMTATSLLPDAARAAGLSYVQLVTHLLELALEKDAR